MAFTQFGWGTAINPAPSSVVTDADKKEPGVPYSIPMVSANTPEIPLGLENYSLVVKTYSRSGGIDFTFKVGSLSWAVWHRPERTLLSPPAASNIVNNRTYPNGEPREFVFRKEGLSFKVFINGEEIVATDAFSEGVTASFNLRYSTNATQSTVSYFILSDDPNQNWSGVKCIAGVLNQPPDQFQNWEGDPTVYTANTIERDNPVYSNTTGAVIEHTVTPYVAIAETEKIVRAGVNITNSQDSDFSLSTKVEGTLGTNTFSQTLPAAADPTTTLVTSAFTSLPGDTPFKLFVKVE